MHELPPLPTPQRLRLRQALQGTCLVLASCGALVAITHAISGLEQLPYALVWTCRGLIYSEAILALFCLLGLLFADPGTVRRTVETTEQIPAQCLGKPQGFMENVAWMAGSYGF